MARRLLEREAELEALSAALARARSGSGSLILIEGAAGLGKTSLLGDAERRAAGTGVDVVRGRGTPLERSIPFGMARQLFERRVARGERGRLLAGAAAPAAVALGGPVSSAAGGMDEELEVLHGLYWLTANLGDERPLLVVVDDLHWADVPSLRFLAYLAQRLDELRVAVVAATRTGEPGAPAAILTELAAAASQRLLRLSALSPEAVTELVRGRHPDADDDFCRACATATAGNPFLLGDLLDAVADEGLAPVAATAERLADLDASTLARRTLVRLEQLGPGAADLARAVAVLGDDAELRHAAALAGLVLPAAETAADALAGAGLLRPGEPLAFVHPLLEAAIRDALPAGERAAAHRTAAERLAAEGAAPERVAAHLLSATHAADPATVQTLVAAADEALSAGAAESAVRYLKRALEEPPPPADRARLMVKLGEAEAVMGDPGALDRLAGALDLLSDPRERAEAHHRLGWTLYRMGDLRAAGQAFKRGVDEYGDHRAADDELAAELRTAWLGVGALTGVVDLPTIDAAAVSGDTPRLATTRAEREMLTQLSIAEVFSCSSHERAAELARRALGSGAMLAESGVSLTFSIAVGALLWSDAIEDAEAELEAGVEHAVRREAPVTAAYVRFGRAWPHLWRGQIDEAIAELSEAWEIWRGGWSLTLPSCGYWLTRAYIEHGDLDAAAALSLPVARLVENDPEVTTWMCGRAMLALAAGDPEAAWAAIERVIAMAPQAAFIHNPAVIPWRGTAALTLQALGRPDEGRRFADEAVELARRFGAPRPISVALRARALLDDDAARSSDQLREAAAVLDASPIVLERARALVDLGACLRRDGHPRDAREPLRTAIDLLRDTSAVALRDRAQGELAAAGGRPRREALTGVESLTPSERRVAELAAAGRSNPDIARELFISRKTVEYHLGGVYRKLEIASREELAVVLEAAAA